MTVGERIRKRRLELNMTQEQLANKMGYNSKVAICKAEKQADNMTSDRLEKFAEALGVKPSYLMGWENTDKYTTADLMIDLLVYDDERQAFELYQKLSKDNKKDAKKYMEYLFSLQGKED